MSEPFDPGLQPERTDLAWRRTALGLMGNGALIARFALDTSLDVVAYALGLVLVVTGIAALAHTRHLYDRRVAALRSGAPTARPELLRALWAVTTTVILGVLVLVAVS